MYAEEHPWMHKTSNFKAGWLQQKVHSERMDPFCILSVVQAGGVAVTNPISQ